MNDSAKHFGFLTSLNSNRRLLVLAMMPVFAAIYYAAFWLRFEGQLSAIEQTTVLSTILFVVAIKTVTFMTLHVFLAWSRYVTFYDLVALIRAATISSLLMVLGDYLFFPDLTLPRSVFLMDWGITVVLIGGLRSASRFWEENEPKNLIANARAPIFIVGANNSGETLLRAIRRNPSLHYRVVGIIALDDASAPGYIGGVPVLGTLDQTCQLATRYGVKEVFITAGDLPGQTVRKLVEDSRGHDVTLQVLPSYEQLLNGKVDLRPRTVSIEDLLRRDPVQLDQRELHRWIDDQVLLVTGSAGSIGSEICRQLLQFSPRKLVLVDRSETGQFFLERELSRQFPDCELVVCMADVSDKERMKSIFAEQRPNIVFHAAAYKHVPLMEANPGEAVKNISVATQRLADLADQFDVTSFVLISTDKAVNPTSVMGTCKRVGELYVQALAAESRCRFVTVRFGNVLDSDGSVIPIFRQQIARGGPVTVTHADMKRFFMTIPEASQLVIQAGAMGKGGEVFVLDMGEPVRIVDLAKDMIRLSGLRLGEDINIEFTGMRPGEKIFEELYWKSEKHLLTSHPKILVAAASTPAVAFVRASIVRLLALSDGPPDEIIRELQDLVPQFQRPLPLPAPRRLAA